VDAVNAQTDGGLRDAVELELAAIPDPELGIDIVSLGLIDGIEVDAEQRVHVRYTLTRLGCPAAPMLHAAIVSRASAVPGVRSADAELVMWPAWTPDRMSPAACTELLGVL
jgi:metal-sulfur cluster biosynthetic enzyme